MLTLRHASLATRRSLTTPAFVVGGANSPRRWLTTPAFVVGGANSPRRWLTTPAFVVGSGTGPTEIASLLDEHGVVVVRDFSTTELERVSQTLLEKTAEAMRLADGVPLGVGSRHSFEEVVLRSPQRYDVPAPFAAFANEDLARCRAVAEEALGADCREAFCGVVLSTPGAPAQGWHADSRHDSAEHGPAKIINVLVALDDACDDSAAGPTEFVPRSHKTTNHHCGAFGEDIVYQRAHTPETVGMSSLDVVAGRIPKGGAVIFDDRILHRGGATRRLRDVDALDATARAGANHSLSDRAVGYFSYSRADVAADTHFEAFRSLKKLRREVGAFDVAREFPGGAAAFYPTRTHSSLRTRRPPRGRRPPRRRRGLAVPRDRGRSRFQTIGLRRERRRAASPLPGVDGRPARGAPRPGRPAALRPGRGRVWAVGDGVGRARRAGSIGDVERRRQRRALGGALNRVLRPPFPESAHP